jgi:hypothetical protein
VEDSGETADLQSLTERHYKQGAKILLASGFYDPTLPAKFQGLTKFLPDAIKAIRTIRVYSNKDTSALSRHLQAWQTPTNPISQGRLNSVEFADTCKANVFYIFANCSSLEIHLRGVQRRSLLNYMYIYRQMHKSLNLVNMTNYLIYTQTYFKRIN